jgi:hypothetical protein
MASAGGEKDFGEFFKDKRLGVSSTYTTPPPVGYAFGKPAPVDASKQCNIPYTAGGQRYVSAGTFLSKSIEEIRHPAEMRLPEVMRPPSGPPRGPPPTMPKSSSLPDPPRI